MVLEYWRRIQIWARTHCVIMSMVAVTAGVLGPGLALGVSRTPESDTEFALTMLMLQQVPVLALLALIILYAWCMHAFDIDHGAARRPDRARPDRST